MNNATGITAGQVRRLTGASRSQLRYWEAHRVIAPQLVTHATRIWRVYTPEQVDRIQKITELLADGMTLKGAIKRLEQAAVNQHHEAQLESHVVA